jgi:hypothetical protein
LKKLLLERGIEVDHVTMYRWVQRFTPLLLDAARFCRHCPSDRWYLDETYVKVNGVWRYVYRAIDQHRQVIDVLLSARPATVIDCYSRNVCGQVPLWCRNRLCCAAFRMTLWCLCPI